MKKNTALLLLSLPFGAALLVALWLLGRPWYHEWKVARFQRKAERQYAARDYRNAWLSAQQTFRLSPTNLAALRLLVDIASLVQSPAELDLRRRLVELQPTLEHKLQAAATSLHAQRKPFPVASEILAELAPTATNSAAYHVVAAQLALQLQQFETAASHLRQAAVLEPTNRLHELNLAALQLGIGKGAAVSAARASLEALASDPACGTTALRGLVNDRLNHRDLAAASGWSERLLRLPGATIADQLKHLGILHESGSSGFTNYLASLQSSATTNAVTAYQIAAWMLNNHLAEPALHWLKSLPLELRLEQPVPVALADALIATHDFVGATRALSGADWGVSEHLRLAFFSEAQRRLQKPLPAAAAWREAVSAAEGQVGALTQLSYLSRDWNLADERAEVLWQIVQKFPRQRWALAELDAYYQQTHDLRGLRRVYQRRLGYDTKDIFTRNNLAAADLLLNEGVPEAAAVAKALHDEQPGNPVITSTYAFALCKQGQTGEGLALLAKLKPEFQQHPGVALYYAVLLAAAHQQPEALRYAALARRGGNLLPEELQLLNAVDGLGTNLPASPK